MRRASYIETNIDLTIEPKKKRKNIIQKLTKLKPKLKKYITYKKNICPDISV